MRQGPVNVELTTMLLELGVTWLTRHAAETRQSLIERSGQRTPPTVRHRKLRGMSTKHEIGPEMQEMRRIELGIERIEPETGLTDQEAFATEIRRLTSQFVRSADSRTMSASVLTGADFIYP